MAVPVASFTATPTSGNAPLTVAFTDTSTNTPTSWSWTFGDGGTSTSQNPSYTYNTAGTYTVALTATNSSGNNTVTRTNLITVTPANLYLQSWDGGTGAADTVAITNANTNGPGNTPVGNPNTANATFSATQAHSGTLSARWNSPASGALSSDTTLPSSVPVGTRAALREYFYFTSFPTLMALIALRSSSTVQFTVSVDATGHLILKNSAGTAVWTSASALTTNTWLRVEVAYTVGTSSTTGSAQIAYYSNNSTTATEDSGLLTALSLSTVASATYRFGTTVTQSAAFSYYRDDWAFNGSLASGFIGPLAVTPVASFTATPTSGTAPLTVAFTDTSTNTPTSWSWTFGDGGTSTSQNPSYLYATGGTYTVTLTATNAAGSNTSTQTSLITAATGPAPVLQADYQGQPNGTSFTTATANSGGDSVPAAVTLGTGSTAKFDSTVGAPETGTTALALGYTTSTGVVDYSFIPSVITHRVAFRQWVYYQAASGAQGILTVRNNSGNVAYVTITATGNLTWTDNAGATVITSSSTFPTGQWVLIQGAITIGTTTSNGSLELQWSLQASPNTVAWSGSLIGTANTGTTSIVLLRLGSQSNSTATHTFYSSHVKAMELASGFIGPITQVPVASFSATPTSGTAPLNVAFTDTSTNSPTSWSWTFGDGGTSTSQSPSYTYAAGGTYTVALTATNAAGSNTVTRTNLITASSPAPSVYLQTWDGGTGAADGVAITNANTNGTGNTPIATPNSANATFSATQAHSGTLSASWYSGASVSLFSDTPIASTVPVGTRAALREYFYFTSFPTLMALIAIRYASGPQLTISVDATGHLILNGASGSTLWTSTNVLTTNTWLRIEAAYTIGTSTTGSVQIAYYAANNTTATEDSGLLTGVGLSSTATTTYRFGTSVTQSTAFSYYRDDWAFNPALPSGFIGPIVQVPVASFSATPTSGTAPLTVSFTDTSTNSPTSWSWSFGDGGTSTSQNPSYSYASAGTYSVSLTATNSAGNGSVTQSNLISVSVTSSAFIQNWDGGTGAANGVIISSSNTNGPGNTAISSVAGSGGTFTTTPVHSGTLGVQWSVPANTSLYADFPIASQTGTRMAMREYVYFSSLPTVVAYINSFRVSAGTLAMAAVVNGSGKYEFRGSANTALWTATNTFPLNQWVRIEFAATISSTANAGTAQVAYYLGDSMTAIEDSGLLTGLGLGTAAATITRIGGLATVGSAVLYYRDDLSFRPSLPSGYIGPSAIVPVASFSTSPTSGISPLAVTFTDTSTNAPISWSWTFGDGGTATTQNPTHTYTGRGVYTVSLTATNTAGNNTVTMGKLIGVNSSTASQVFQNWDGGTGAANGVTISTTNTNGPGNTPLATTTIGSAATLTFSTEQTHSNSLSAKYDQSSGSSGITFSTVAVTTTVGVRCVYRVYVYMSVLPAATQWSFGNVYGGGSQVAGLFVTTSGTIGYGLSSAFDSGVTMPTNQWVRVEMGVTVGATAAQGYVDCAIFLSADSMVPTFSSGPINTTTVGTTPVDTARIGGGTNAAARTWYLDDWAFDSNMPSGYIGPSFPPSQGNVKTYNGAMFAPKPVKVWDGAGWIVKPVKRWDGTQWSETSY